jgi:3-keto-5-aminohexanoate cleavage enzyme
VGASTKPAIIEAAISPLVQGAQTADVIVDEANACLDAGAGIVHHHFDRSGTVADSIAQLADIWGRVAKAYPQALHYTGYLKGTTAVEENEHLRPLAEAGLLNMFPIDPGITTKPVYNVDGLPTLTSSDGLRFDESHEMVELSKELGVPISLGVFEPVALRWIVDYARQVGFSDGTMIKFYFGGTHKVDAPGKAALNHGLPPTAAALAVYLEMMEGCNLPWTASLFGDPILDTPLARLVLEAGGHLRVGIEDAAGMSPNSNVEMVRSAITLAKEVGRPVASNTQALEVLTAL